MIKNLIARQQKLLRVLKESGELDGLVEMMEKATSIVDFFDKQDENKRVQKEIKRAVLKQQYGTKTLVSAVTDRFMELARVKFK